MRIPKESEGKKEASEKVSARSCKSYFSSGKLYSPERRRHPLFSQSRKSGRTIPFSASAFRVRVNGDGMLIFSFSQSLMALEFSIFPFKARLPDISRQLFALSESYGAVQSRRQAFAILAIYGIINKYENVANKFPHVF